MVFREPPVPFGYKSRRVMSRKVYNLSCFTILASVHYESDTNNNTIELSRYAIKTSRPQGGGLNNTVMGQTIVILFADRVTCKQVLNFMVILGFMFNYMLRVNLTIAIVAMVHPSNKTDSSGHLLNHTSECSGLGGSTANNNTIARVLDNDTLERTSETNYSSPMTSLVLTDSSQLTADGFEKLPDQIMYPSAETYDLQKHVFISCQKSAVNCQSAPKKSWGYCS
uniref:Uncharacterized protein n=1 Tax=Timema genevievae TaxID=629358 RepID=A0A7R9K7W2_TIMGE|nr:unnamed protein product [Timema genevievae]